MSSAQSLVSTGSHSMATSHPGHARKQGSWVDLGCQCGMEVLGSMEGCRRWSSVSVLAGLYGMGWAMGQDILPGSVNTQPETEVLGTGVC